MAPSSIFDVSQYLKYDDDNQQTIFFRAFSVRYSVGFLFSDKYDATKNHPWGGKGGIILKLQNNINIPDGTRSSMIRGIMKEVLFAKADRVRFEPNMKGWSKTGKKSIIGMDSQESHIISDAVELGISKLTAWSLVKDQREVEELPLVCISVFGTYIAKLKPLFVKVKNEKQVSLDRNAPTCKAILLWCLQPLLQLNIITVRDARNVLVEKKIIENKEGKLPK